MTNDELRESIQNHKEYSILKQDSTYYTSKSKE
jgi:hypothetical protein